MWLIIKPDNNDAGNDGQRRRVAVVRDSRGTWVGYRGGQLLLPTERPGARLAAVASNAAPGTGPIEVRAPMTGRVVAVLVKAGDSVAQQAPLLLLEAMKMEYRLVAPAAATVTSVHTEMGALVELGAVLVVLQL